MKQYYVFLALFINGLIPDVWASNELRELQYAEEIETSFAIGKVVWLKIKDKKFISLYTETEEIENLGTAIILHSMDGHPNQEKVVNPLRVYLPQHNWATLALQMPVLSVESKQDEYYPLFDDATKRIQAGVDYLISAGVKNIVLVGYGLGGMMATYYIKGNANSTGVKAIVTISLKVPNSNRKQAQVIKFIREIKLPFLDIFAEYDQQDVIKSARKRRVAGKANSAYRQFKIKSEGHAFQHDEGLLVKRVYSWINRTFR